MTPFLLSGGRDKTKRQKVSLDEKQSAFRGRNHCWHHMSLQQSHSVTWVSNWAWSSLLLNGTEIYTSKTIPGAFQINVCVYVGTCLLRVNPYHGILWSFVSV